MSWWETRKALEFTVVSEKVEKKKGHKFETGQREKKNKLCSVLHFA